MEIEQYYRKEANKGRADEYRKGIAIFHIGLGDIEMFPELQTIDSLWIYKDNGILMIDIRTIRNYCPRLLRNH